jgi:hypothetical protein
LGAIKKTATRPTPPEQNKPKRKQQGRKKPDNLQRPNLNIKTI